MERIVQQQDKTIAAVCTWAWKLKINKHLPQTNGDRFLQKAMVDHYKNCTWCMVQYSPINVTPFHHTGYPMIIYTHPIKPTISLQKLWLLGNCKQITTHTHTHTHTWLLADVHSTQLEWYKACTYVRTYDLISINRWHPCMLACHSHTHQSINPHADGQAQLRFVSWLKDDGTTNHLLKHTEKITHASKCLFPGTYCSELSSSHSFTFYVSHKLG